MKKIIVSILPALLCAVATAQSSTVPEYGVECREFLSKDGCGRAQQGMEICKGYIFSGEDGGHVNVYDFDSASGKPVGGFDLASSGPDNHVNNLEFGLETKEGASFPLLYISNGKVGSAIEWTCFVESITLKDGVFSSEIAQTIVLDGCKGWKDKGYEEIFGAPSWLIDRDDKALWVFSARKRTTLGVTVNSADNNYIATKFRIPTLSEGEKIILGADDILDQAVFPYDVWFTQAGCIYDGRIYYCYGIGKQDWDRPSVICAYDLKEKKIAARYDLQEDIPYEMEDIVIKDGWMYVNTNTPRNEGIAPIIYKVSLPKNSPDCRYIRNFLSHRGVHLGYSIAGENSLEAVALARRAGFRYIETDCRFTADSVMVIIHDATLNRTFTMADGSPIEGKVAVKDLTFEQLRRDYRLKADRPQYRSVCPTLEEYLEKCKEEGFRTVFIEPKIADDTTGRFYRTIIETADRILSRDGYVVTSCNGANDIIRHRMQPSDKSLRKVTLMGILYQSDYETLTGLGNTLIAVNPEKITGEKFHDTLLKIKSGGRYSETNCGLTSLYKKDPVLYLQLIQKVFAQEALADIIATDLCAADWHGQGRVVADFTAKTPKELAAGLSSLPKSELYGIYIDVEFTGEATLVVGPDRFRVNSADFDGHIVYQRCIYDSAPSVSFEDPAKGFRMKKCSVKAVEM